MFYMVILLMACQETSCPFSIVMDYISLRENDVNRFMSSVCVSVEWAFGKLVQYFTYLDFKQSEWQIVHVFRWYHI